MNCNMIHETVIRDIADVIYDVKNSDEIKGFRNKKSFRSVAQASSNLTLVFPIIVSKNMSIDNAAMISKAMERKAVSMLQMLFSAMNISAVDSGMEYISKFHTNLKIDDKMSVDSFIDALDKFVVNNESVISDIELYETAKRDLKNLNYFLPDSLNESSLNDYKVIPQAYFGEATIVNEAMRNPRDRRAINTHRRNNAPPNININIPNTPTDTTHTSYSYQSRELNDLDRMNMRKASMDLVRNQLLDSDVKKANELVPTMMIVNFTSVNYDTPIQDQMVIGVKAKIYPVDSVDILNRITIKNQDNNGMLKFVRATTREISFVKDFMFAIEKAKIDALSQSKRGSSSKLWKILERRAVKSKFRRTLGHTNDASAISTLVLSQEEVEYLKKTENIDIENPSVIRPIMESYNLMGVCIVDESMEVAKFIFDTGDDIYESLSFSHLERENNNGMDRKVINLMTKMVR